MLVAVFGDTHGHLDLMYAKALAWQDRTGIKLDYVFQVGDFGIWPYIDKLDRATKKKIPSEDKDPRGDFPKYLFDGKEIPIPTYFVRGNHEDQVYLRDLEHTHGYTREYRAWSETIEICPNLHWIPDGHIIEIEGTSTVLYSSGERKEEKSKIRVAGLGGNFSYKTWKQGQDHWKLQGRQMNHIIRPRWQRLMDQDPVDVILTHDGPTEIGLSGRYGIGLPKDEMSGGGIPQLRQLIETKCLKMSFSGHWHEYRVGRIGRSQHYSLDKVDPGDDFGYPNCMVVVEL